MAEEWQSPSVSSSARLDDILEDSPHEGVERASNDSGPLKPGAGDAPVFPPVVSVPPPNLASRAFEPAESTDIGGIAIGDDDSLTPPPLPARNRPEPDSTSETAPAAATESTKTRSESVDESFFSPSVAPECVMQSSADFSVNLKDQPASAEPVGPQDAAPVHVEPVPVFSMSSFSSDSIPELIMSTKAVHSDDLIQTEVPINTVLQTISGFMENTMDKQVADHLEKAHGVGEKAQVKPTFRESSELDTLISVDESPFQYKVGQCVEPNGSKFKGTTSSLVEETMPEQVQADKGGLTKISEIKGIDKVRLSDDREVELETHLRLMCEEAGASETGMSPLVRIVEEKESMRDMLDFNERTIKPTDSGLNFCYGDILEVKERNELKSSGTGINQVAMIDTDTSKSVINVTVKSESGMFQDQEVSKTPCDTEEQIVAKGTSKLGYADLENLTFVEQSFEQDGKLSPTDEAYFAVSQVASEPQTYMTYATFDSYNMFDSPQSDYFSTNEMVPDHDAAARGKTELKETSVLPLQLTAIKSEVTKKVEDTETKSLPPVDTGNKPISKVDVTSASEIHSQLFDSVAVKPDQIMKTDSLDEIITSEQTAQSFAPDHSQRISEIESPGLVVGIETSEEIRKSTQELNPFEPLPSTSEQCVLGESEEVQGLTDMIVKTPTCIEKDSVPECVTILTDPECATTQSVAQNANKEQIVHALLEPFIFTDSAANGIPEVTNIQHLFEEQKTVSNRGGSEDTIVISEQVPVSEEINLPEHQLVGSIIESEGKGEDFCVRFGYSEPDVSENINQLVTQSSKQELLPSKIVEEKNYPKLLTPKHEVLADTSVTMKSQDMTICKEVVISKSEPILGAQGATTIGMNPVDGILADYKHVEHCSLSPLSLHNQTEIPSLIKNVTEDVLTGSVKVTEKAAIEILLSHQEAPGEILPSPTVSEKRAVEESLPVPSMIEDNGTPTTLSMPNEDLSRVGRGLALKALTEETCLATSQPVNLTVAPSLQDDIFPDNHLEKLGEMKAKIDGHSEKLEIAQVQIKPQELPTDASFLMNEEVTKASKEVVTKILETSVALAEVLGKKEGTRAASMSQQEADIIFSPVGEGDVSKKNVPVETLVPELPTFAESTETSKDSAVAAIADLSVKPDKKSVVDLIYWRDIKKTGLVFGASLFLLLSMTIFSIVSVIAYLALALLSVTISFRIYRGILQAVQKSDDGHPFKACLETEVAVSDELVHKYSDIGLGHINHVITELRRLFLVQDLVDSLKFSVLMWLLTYVGALFNGLTLLIIALVAVFSIPVVYERHQAQIDHYIGIASKQIRDVTAKIQAKVPGLKRKTE
ncbi:reticulon-4-like isoform X2 [Heptranchias perlo]|uniref:reticulon-4-like isoform X2 n=1 Tax=Heptranchias perlo TaxID=212740 RepID=UPI00355A835D